MVVVVPKGGLRILHTYEVEKGNLYGTYCRLFVPSTLSPLFFASTRKHGACRRRRKKKFSRMKDANDCKNCARPEVHEYKKPLAFFFLRLLFVFALDLVFPVTFACWLLGFAWLLLSFRLALNPNFFSSYSPPQSVLREDSSLRQTQVARADLARLTRLLLVPGRPSVVVMMDTTGLLMIPMTCLAQVSRFIIVANPKSQIAALWGMSC